MQLLTLNPNKLVSNSCHYSKWVKSWNFFNKYSKIQFLRVLFVFEYFDDFSAKTQSKNVLKVIFMISSASSIQPCENITRLKFLLDFCSGSTLLQIDVVGWELSTRNLDLENIPSERASLDVSPVERSFWFTAFRCTFGHIFGHEQLRERSIGQVIGV